MYFDEISSAGGLPPMGGDSNVYAQEYADSKGISLDEAKAELRAKFGDPEKPNTVFNSKGDMLKTEPQVLNFSGAGANFPVNPYGATGAAPVQLEAYIKHSAEQLGISEDVFARMLGLPDRASEGSDDKVEMLKQYGIPEDVINQGDDAIRKYAQENNIDLPAKRV